MGAQPSKQNVTIQPHKFFTYNEIGQYIDSYGVEQVDHNVFVKHLFVKFDNIQHPRIGSMIVSNTYILQLLFRFLSQGQSKDKIKISNLKQKIKKMYNSSQKAISYSFRMIDLNNDKKITNVEFLNYIDNCFISLMQAAQRIIVNRDDEFKINFKNWTKTNKKKFMESVLKIFNQNAKTDINFWTESDFKRWIQDKNHWSLNIQIGNLKLKTPLNLLCLFALES